MSFLPQPERVLVVDDDRGALEAMTETIRTLGLMVYEAENGEVAWRTFEQESPDLVVTDVCMPDGDGLTLTSRIKVHQPSCPVIVVTGFGGEDAAIAALKAGASDFLVKPFQVNDLRAAVDRACALIQARLAEEALHPAVDRMELTMTISNVPEQVGGVINALLRTVDGCVSEAARLHIRVALRELVLNAIEHGNLNISFEEKAEALTQDRYEQLLEDRRRCPEYSSRRVRLSMSHDVITGKVQFRICDEGSGFDWQQMLNRSVHELPKGGGSGRGIFLVRTLLPDVAYQGAGNDVTLTVHHAPIRQ